MIDSSNGDFRYDVFLSYVAAVVSATSSGVGSVSLPS